MIQERPDYKTLDPSDILERLNTHEFQLSEKRDIYGPNYGRTCGLKAKVVSSSEEESDYSSGEAEDLGKELAMLVKKLLRSLDNSFDTLALMIQECPDFRDLDPSDILDRLNTHEF